IKRLVSPIITYPLPASAQISAKPLDALARLLKGGRGGRVGDAERWAEAERRALDHRHPLGFQKLGHEILVGEDLLAGWRRLADGTKAGGIDVERSLRLRAVEALGLVEHGNAEIAALLEDLVVLGNEVLGTVERLDRRPLRCRRRARGRLRLDDRHGLDQRLG